MQTELLIRESSNSFQSSKRSHREFTGNDLLSDTLLSLRDQRVLISLRLCPVKCQNREIRNRPSDLAGK